MTRRVGATQAGGWWWRRGNNGTVTVWAGEDGPEVTVDAAAWAHIVAWVSAAGNTRQAYRAALTLHEGNLP